MGYIGGHDGSGGGVRIPLQGLPRTSRAIDISADEAIALPSLLLEGLIIWGLGGLTGVAYQIIAFGNYGEPRVYIGTGFLVAVFFCGAIRLAGSANPMNASRNLGRARSAATIWLGTFVFLTVVAFSMRIGTDFSRGAVFSFFLSGLPIVMAARVLVPRFLARTLYANAYHGSEVIIAASRGNGILGPLTQEMRAKGYAGIHVIEFDGGCSQVDWPVERQRLLKRVLDTARIAGPGEIYILSDAVSAERISSVQSGLRLVPRAICLVPPEAVSDLFGLPVRRVGRAVAIETQREPLSLASRAMKRGIDIAASAAALILLAPALGVIMIAVKIDSRGPVFFRQRRNGHRGKQFRIVKFRTMSVLEDGDEVTQVHRDDRRVTRVGRFLRKSSFDELPQLWNILRGEMSLVGPRPHAIAHDEMYAKLIENYELRQHVRPGVTGWAQVHGLRGETPTVDLMFRRIEFDLWYAANCSVVLDLQILARTVLTVLRQDNAY